MNMSKKTCILPKVFTHSLSFRSRGHNNWHPSEVLGEPSYKKNTLANDLYVTFLQAFYKFNPTHSEDAPLYRSQRFGKHLEIFFPDFHSQHDSNPENENLEFSNMMGEEQLEWLKEGLKASDATWKILSSHNPLSIISGRPGDFDAYGNDNSQILGRENELKDLLKFIYDSSISNFSSITSDVHYMIAVKMLPESAKGGFTDFKPLFEFVIGPIHAGLFGPNT